MPGGCFIFLDLPVQKSPDLLGVFHALIIHHLQLFMALAERRQTADIIRRDDEQLTRASDTLWQSPRRRYTGGSGRAAVRPPSDRF